MNKPIAIATIVGLEKMPTGSRVTFAAKVLRCWKEKGSAACLLADESGFIEVDGQGVEAWAAQDSFRIQYGVLQGAPVKPGASLTRKVRLDRTSRAERLLDPVAPPNLTTPPPRKRAR